MGSDAVAEYTPRKLSASYLLDLEHLTWQQADGEGPSAGEACAPTGRSRSASGTVSEFYSQCYVPFCADLLGSICGS